MGPYFVMVHSQPMLSRFCAGFLMVLVCLSSVPIQADADPPAETLRPGEAIERRLTAVETHAFTADLAPGKRWLVVIEQRGIDVVLAATAANGATIAVDAPTYRQGIESMLLPREVSGTVRIEVRSASKAVAPGSYQIAIRELAGATAKDRRWLAAEAVMTEAGRLNHQGTAAARQQAVAKYVEALGHWRRLGDSHREAHALFSLGTLSLRASEPQRALDAYRLALPLLRVLEERDAEAIVLSNLGLAHWRLGNNDEAHQLFDEAMSLQRSLGNRYGEAAILNNLCVRSRSQGELTEPLACYRRALELLHELGELQLESTLLSNIGSVYNDLGEPRSALEHHQRALVLRQTVGDLLGEARTLKSIAVVYRHIGEDARGTQPLCPST